MTEKSDKKHNFIGINNIPKNISDWNLDTINKLIQLRDAESENLDFKEIVTDITKEICAFANTTGGFLVFGIAPDKNSIHKTILGYKKIGFKKGKEDEIGLEISNQCFLISPVPSYEIKHIQEDSVFYVVIKIPNEISKRPFIIKNKGQCFIRMDSSSRPAPRSTIMNLFGASIDYRKNIQNLQSSCIFLKGSLSHTISYLNGISPNDQTRPAPVDLTLLKSSLLINMGFVSENDLLGYRTENSIHKGITTVIDTIGQLNAQLYVYNTTENNDIKNNIKNTVIGEAKVLANDIKEIPIILDKTITVTEKFLADSQ